MKTYPENHPVTNMRLGHAEFISNGLKELGHQMGKNFDVRLENFVSGCQAICDQHTIGYSKISIDPRGMKYVRIISNHGGSNSVHCFVDKTNGDVLKAASWKAPAKHARGNIFDEHNGLKSMQWTGPAYLR